MNEAQTFVHVFHNQVKGRPIFSHEGHTLPRVEEFNVFRFAFFIQETNYLFILAQVLLASFKWTETYRPSSVEVRNI